MDLESQVNFLREFAEFSLEIPLKTAEYLFEALTKAHSKNDFDTVAKLQVKLHAEMVASLETSGALLLSFSKWDEPGDIRRTLLTYRNREVHEFLEVLYESHNPLEILCFPKKNDISEHYEDKYQEDINKYYNNEELLKSVKHIMDTYRNEIVTKSYNKVKHAGMAIRNVEVLGGEEKHGKTKAYIPLYDSDKNKITFVYFSVVGAEGIKLAKKYLQNVETTVKITKVWCKFFAYCLEKGLLLPSKEQRGLVLNFEFESQEWLKGKIREAVRIFIERDKKYLLEVRIYEPTISHRIALYLESLFLEYDVDCEYNKNLLDRKRDSAGKRIRPDIIIHKRGYENRNLIAIEIKRCGKTAKLGKKDIGKLRDAVKGNLNYDLGVFLGILKRKIDICWVEKIGDQIFESSEEIV